MICIESYVAYCTPLHSKPGCFVEACKLPRFVILGMVYDWFDHASPIVSLICWIETVPTIRSTSRAMSSSCCRCGVAIGWFSIHETNQDTYRQGKLKKLLVRTLRYSLWVVERGNSRKNVGRCSLFVHGMTWAFDPMSLSWSIAVSPQSPWDRKHPPHPMVGVLSKASGCYESTCLFVLPGLPGLRSSKSPRLWWRTWCKTHWSSSPWILWTTTAMAWRWWDFPRKAWFTIWLFNIAMV